MSDHLSKHHQPKPPMLSKARMQQAHLLFMSKSSGIRTLMPTRMVMWMDLDVVANEMMFDDLGEGAGVEGDLDMDDD